jgi:hypothetical protein
VQGIVERSSELDEFCRSLLQMFAGICEVTFDSSRNRHRRAYLQVQGERPHLLSPLIHLGTLCRPKRRVGRSTPPQVGSPKLSPVTIWRGHRHESVHLVTPVRIVSVECPGKPRSATVVVDSTPAMRSKAGQPF